MPVKTATHQKAPAIKTSSGFTHILPCFNIILRNSFLSLSNVSCKSCQFHLQNLVSHIPAILNVLIGPKISIILIPLEKAFSADE